MNITYIRAAFGALRNTTTMPLYKIDSGLILQIVGVADLPEYFQADFSNSEKGTATRMLGHDGEVVVPNQLLKTGLPIWCWIYVTNDVTGRTVYTVKIPVKQRSDVDGIDPTQEQVDIINQAINALNDAGDSASQAAAAALGYVNRAETAAESAESAQSSATQSAADAQGYADNAYQDSTNAAESEAKAKRHAQDAEVDANRAEMAAKNAGYFDVEIDARDHLIYTRTDEVDANFKLDDRGHLVMEVD